MFKIENLVSNTFKDYDHNNNGLIEYKKNAGNAKIDENLREEIQPSYKGNNVYKDDVVTLSNKKLFTAADKDKDGIVTPTELTGFFSKFDKNKNGQLDLRNFSDWLLNENKDQAEYKHFSKAYPEKIISKKPVKQ